MKKFISASASGTDWRDVVQKLLKEKSAQSGAITFEFTVWPDGLVTNYRVLVNSTGSKDLEDFTSDTIRELDFGKANVDPRNIEYKFIFSAPY